MMLNYIFLLVAAWFHPLHLSISELVLNPKSGNLEISQRIFIDDLEAALKEQSGQPVDLSKVVHTPEAQQLVGSYLQQHFALKVNGKTVKAQYLGFQIEEDVVWAYLEVGGIKKLNVLNVANTLFFERFSDQVNIITVTVGEKQQSLRLDASQPGGMLKF